MMRNPKHTKEDDDDGNLQTLRRAPAGGHEVLLRMRRSGGQHVRPYGAAADRIPGGQSEKKEKKHLQTLVVLGAGADRDREPGGKTRRKSTVRSGRETDSTRGNNGSAGNAEAPAPTAEPAPEPSAEPAPEVQVTLSENEIRPEIKEFLDAYEVFMDEYVDFMQKYLNADPTSMAEMLGDYYSFLSRYTEFEEKLDAFSESELTDAELAY